MKIDQLIYFNEAAKLEHIGKASKVLGISAGAISHSIGALEDELGYELFEKKGKNIVLTDSGKKLLEQSSELIHQFQNLKQSLLGSQQDKNSFKIAATHLLAHDSVTATWAKLSKTYPLVTLEIMSHRSAEVVSKVLAREVDFGVCFSPQPHPDLEIKEIHQGELLITVRKSHPILKLPVKDRIAALSNYPAVLPKAYQGIDVCIGHPMFEKHGLVPKAMTLTDSYDISLALIQKSECWGFTPSILLKKYKSELVGIKSEKNWVAPYGISVVQLKKKFIPSFFDAFTHDLQKQF